MEKSADLFLKEEGYEEEAFKLEKEAAK